MKVEYKCTLERVNDAIAYAEEHDVEIDYIELTPVEWYAFHRKLGSFSKMLFRPAQTDVSYRGVEIRKSG